MPCQKRLFVKKSTISLSKYSELTLSVSYSERHKTSKEAFIRERKLPFQSVLQLLLRKSVKSLQLVLNEWFDSLDKKLSASAFTQARSKFRHTAFIELLEECVVKVMYEGGDYKEFKGRRLVALDGSTLRLPNTEATREHFGIIKYVNGKKTREMNRVEAKMTVLYDVLNKIPISAKLNAGRTNDIKACRQHLTDLNKNDVVIADRAFGAYQFFAEVMAQNADFIVRCKYKTFGRYHQLETSTDAVDRTVLIHPVGYVKKGEIAKFLRVRFVKIVLSNGEIEILATSLLDTKKFPPDDFKELYRLRWGIETYFQVLKSRLCLDNFTGKSVESIHQDFYSTIFLSGLETILTDDANQSLSSRKTKNTLQVNKAQSFHVIKHNVIKLMNKPPPDFEKRITALFIQNPTSVRPGRFRLPRNTKDETTVKALNFQRYARKHVF